MKPSLAPGVLRGVYRVDFPAHVSPEEFSAHLDEVDRTARAEGRITLVIDLRRAGLLPLDLRAQFVERLHQGQAGVAPHLAGVAHVVSSALVLGVMTVIWRLTRPPFPTLITRSPEDAEAWAIERLRAGG